MLDTEAEWSLYGSMGLLIDYLGLYLNFHHHCMALLLAVRKQRPVVSVRKHCFNFNYSLIILQIQLLFFTRPDVCLALDETACWDNF